VLAGGKAVRESGKWAISEGGGGKKFGVGGSKMTRMYHDNGGGGEWGNLFFRTPPSLKAECQGGLVWTTHHRYERVDLSCLDL
jgi:hypothetical protein